MYVNRHFLVVQNCTETATNNKCCFSPTGESLKHPTFYHTV